MMDDFSKEAAALAAKPQVTVTFRDEATGGTGFVYMASNPALDGCIAQGATPEEALENLNEVRTRWFAHYLEHGLPIPNTDPPDEGFASIRLP